jgi:hypothetical protein
MIAKEAWDAVNTCTPYHPESFVQGYIAGAEPREKRIAELEEKIKSLEGNSSLHEGILWNDIHNQDKKIAELEAQIEKMKWHKVSDRDLPKDRHNVYVVYLNGYYQLEKTIASFRHKYWVFNGLKTECEVIAWCELPKWEIKEND